MLKLALGFLAGCWLAHSSDVLLAAGDILCALCGGLLAWHYRAARMLVGLLLGVAWASALALWLAPVEISGLPTSQTYRVPVQVLSMPVKSGSKVRFVGRLEQIDGKPVNARLRISWKTHQLLRPGDRWELPLRIRQATSYHSPGSWDYAGWLYGQGIRYTAYVKPGRTTRVTSTPCCWLARWRQEVRERLVSAAPPGGGRAMLLALVLGDRSELSVADKALLAQTGTSHLVAISGLHVGLIGGLAGFLVAGVWRRVPRLCRRTPAKLAGIWAAVAVATVYALLSGMGLPVQRALVMLCVVALALSYRRAVDPWQMLGMALLVVLVIDPLAAHSAGLWLSFIAVAAILLVLPQLMGRSRFIQAGILQLAISLALYPVLLAFHMPLAPWGAVINLIMVPLYALLLLPASLMATCFLLLGDWAVPLLMWVSQAHVWTLEGLSWLASQLPTVAAHGWHLIPWLMLSVATLWLLLPCWPGKSSAAVLWLLANVPATNGLAEGELEMTLLDVGQGLSAILRTRDHVLLFDTGAAYSSGFNLADAVVLPALRYQGVTAVDVLLLSHADNDHAGGAQQIQQGIEVKQIIAGEPSLPHHALCDGQAWTWNRVQFALAPSLGYRHGNNASCVLLVSHAAGNLLISGDAEVTAERRHLPWVTAQGPISVVVAGHHGSLTSSSPAWVHGTEPKYVLYAAGQGNRWGFPKPAVTQRWTRVGSQGLNTATLGAIRFVWTADGRLAGPWAWRTGHARHWHYAVP